MSSTGTPRTSEGSIDDESEAYSRWIGSIHEQARRIAFGTLAAFFGIYLANILPSLRPVFATGADVTLDALRTVRWNVVTGLTQGDTLALISQCIVIIATLAIAAVAAPRISSLVSATNELTEPLSLLQWLGWLGKIAGIVAALSNALALSVLLEWATSVMTPTDPGRITGGLLFSSAILAAVGSVLAGLVVQRQSGIGEVQRYVKEQSLLRVRLRITRLTEQGVPRSSWVKRLVGSIALLGGSTLISTLLTGLFQFTAEPSLGLPRSMIIALPYSLAFSFLMLLLASGFFMIPTYLRWWAISRSQARLRNWMSIAIWVPPLTWLAWTIWSLRKSDPDPTFSPWVTSLGLFGLMAPGLFAAMVAATMDKLPAWNPGAHMASTILGELDGLTKDLQGDSDSEVDNLLESIEELVVPSIPIDHPAADSPEDTNEVGDSGSRIIPVVISAGALLVAGGVLSQIASRVRLRRRH